jgi:quercetin dioxygenase-like cupin family protein
MYIHAAITMHQFGRFEEGTLTPPPVYHGHSEGYRQSELVGRASGSVHTGLTMNDLAPAGWIDPHVHAFEESFYILSGEALVSFGGVSKEAEVSSYRLGPGDYGAFKVGTPHAWRTAGSTPVRWLQMAAPQPKPVGAERDTFFLAGRPRAFGYEPIDAPRLDLNDRGGHLLGHFDATQIPPPAARTGAIAGLEGVFLKWLLDENVGTVHQRLLFIEYQPGVSIALHDHTFEESYFILSGEVQGTLDGKTYLAKPGDVLWTGVGCVHTFVNVSDEPVRWLETFAPQPPRENVFRFMAEWNKKARELEGLDGPEGNT